VNPMPESSASIDAHLMELALQQAALSLTLSAPNPRVGCVLADAQGRVLGLGHTQRVGGPHAEVMALRDAQRQGHALQGATAYVTLEPCSHQGRTGPCCEALLAAGIRRVVAAVEDPNPQVRGQGFARLRAAGVDVQVGLGEHPARELNIGFFKRMTHGLPWVRMKLAASLDGKTALLNGNSQWITSPAARRDGHAWRARACALLTGVGTVREDDPQLDVREVHTLRQPLLVVVDSRLETPPQARLFQPTRPVLICAAQPHADRAAALQARGAEVLVQSLKQPKVDLQVLLQELARREINEVHIEAGHLLNGSFIRAGLVDEWLVYLAPRLIGQGRDMAALGPIEQLGQALPLRFEAVDRIGADLRILARPDHGPFA